MRKLNDSFVKGLNTGGLFNPIVKYVLDDSSLDLEIRNGYISIYFKGNSILKLSENGSLELHNKFLKGLNLGLRSFSNFNDVKSYLDNVPMIKANVTKVKSKRPTLEIEYEQLLIRSNNLNQNVNSDIFITDRQYADNTNNSRFDLSGFYWSRKGRKQGQTVPLTFLEVKYSLNPDIKSIDQQIDKYYNAVKSNITEIAEETEYIKNLKIELGLIKQPKARLDALKTLKISNNIDDVRFIIALIDYNPNSKLFSRTKLQSLPFSSQIQLFNSRLAIWENELENI
jgi:hypothetical protein